MSLQHAAVLGFHLTESEVSTSLAIIAIGLALTAAAAWNIIVTSSPKRIHRHLGGRKCILMLHRYGDRAGVGGSSNAGQSHPK